MSAGKTTTRAARSPRATTPKGGRPWYAPRPRCAVADGLGAFLMRRERTPYNARPIARCDSLYQAEQLAAALNRGERAHKTIIPRLRCARFVAETSAMNYRDALRVLVDAVCATREPPFGPRRTSPKLAAEQLAGAMVAAGRVLGNEPTFAPGGEVAR